MNQFSFSDQEEPQELHSLQQELGEDELDNWMGRQLHKSMEEPQENKAFSQIDINIASEGEIEEKQFTKRSSNCEDVLSVLNAEAQGEKQNQEVSVGDGTNSISGQTFYEESGTSTTVHKSAVEEGWRRQSGDALIEFSSISDHIYLPLMDNLSKMMEHIQELTKKTSANLDMYHSFFNIKLEQERQRYQVLRKRVETSKQLRSNQLMRDIYIEERAALDGMMAQSERKGERLNIFCENLEESCNRLQILLSKTLELRNRKITHIFRHLSKTHAIYTELLTLIDQPPNKRPIRWVGRTDMHCDRYLQRKYLQEREKIFLQLLKTAGEKIIGLTHCIFLKEEPTICSLINKEMRRYQQLNKETYGTEQSLEIEEEEDKEVNMEEVDKQLSGVLLEMLPKQWEIPDIKSSESHCETMINYLNSYLQNQIFLPTVSIDPQLILAREDARWVPIISKQPKNRNQKQNIKDDNQPSSSSLANKDNLSGKDIRKGFNVKIVLTLDKYLHLECAQKIACLKLKKLKLKRKGFNSIILIEKNKLSALFSQPNLGELIFDRQGAADDFAGVILSTI